MNLISLKAKWAVGQDAFIGGVGVEVGSSVGSWDCMDTDWSDTSTSDPSGHRRVFARGARLAGTALLAGI